MDPDDGSQELLVAIEDTIAPDDAGSIRGLVDELRELQLSIGAPEFVDTEDNTEQVAPGATAARTLGAVVRLPAPSRVREREAAALADVRLILSRFRSYSERTGRTFAVDMNRECIGWIEAGVLSESLTEGLLDAWEVELARL
jgi:hypothetical protein